MVKQMSMFDRIRRLFQSESARRSEDAAELFLEANDKTDTDEAFEAYFEFVNEDSENAEAMHRLNEVWEGTGALPNPPYPTASELAETGGRAQPFLSAPAIAMATSVAGVAMLTVFMFFAPPQQTPTPSVAFSTDTGERRDIVLEDGSTVTLGAASVIEVAIDDRARTVELIAGDSYLDVAADEDRVFVVRAGDVTARAVGTEFSVNIRGKAVAVAVSEGVVDVLRGNTETVVARLTAGRRIYLDPDRGNRDVEPIDIDSIAAWRRGVLILDDESLPYAIDTINRYYHGSVSIEGAQLNEIRASGVVDMHNPGPWLESLQSVLPVEVRQTAENTYVLSHE